ncbi:BQ5605_C017g08328 [Microbotryum silenes-dioicae]|uniref:BQ5605_C017g08328 protein n=1 Tax=Microbotryum silenes-dioicae TaxID=796604 RepID=A0A2X0NS35_9BASI|nr:BQ5605_C017g08328 [Microbotryum silenes-dioicae]
MGGSTSGKDENIQSLNGKGTARKYLDADGMYVRNDKGDMSLCEYTCKHEQTDNVPYNRLRVGAGNFNEQNPTTD